jgi:hypothetical protein
MRLGVLASVAVKAKKEKENSRCNRQRRTRQRHRRHTHTHTHPLLVGERERRDGREIHARTSSGHIPRALLPEVRRALPSIQSGAQCEWSWTVRVRVKDMADWNARFDSDVRCDGLDDLAHAVHSHQQ